MENYHKSPDRLTLEDIFQDYNFIKSQPNIINLLNAIPNFLMILHIF